MELEHYPFQELTAPPGDQILALGDEFKHDKRPGKVSLVVGVYLGSDGRPYEFPSVKEAWGRVPYEPGYLPLQGDPKFVKGIADIVFGENSPCLEEGRVAMVGMVGGTGANAMFAKLLKMAQPKATVLFSDPTWPNHGQIFGKDQGLDVRSYPHLHHGRYDLQAHLDAIAKVPDGGVIALHAVGHNTTGMDPTPEEWTLLAAAIARRKLMAFFDVAYAGFGETLEKDTDTIRLFVDKGISVAVAWSASKNMGLYGERVGALYIVAPTADDAKIVQQNITTLCTRPTWSTPSKQGERVAGIVLSDKELMGQWKEELAEIAAHISRQRRALAQTLGGFAPGLYWGHGLFSLLPLSDQEVEALRRENAVYLLPGGKTGLARANVMGVPEESIKDVAGKILEVARVS